MQGGAKRCMEVQGGAGRCPFCTVAVMSEKGGEEEELGVSEEMDEGEEIEEGQEEGEEGRG